MATPRVLFVDHAGVLGGAELYLLDVARTYGDAATVLLFEDGPFRERLTEEGLRVHVVPAPDGFLSAQKQSGVTDALRALPGYASLVHRLRRHAREHEVVFANSQKALVAAGPAAWTANRPFVWNLHDILTADHFSPLIRQVAVRMANAFTHRVVVNSRATRQAFAESGGNASRCRVVYNGFDPNRFAPPDSGQLHELRKDLGIDEATPTVGVFGRLAPWKGQHVLIDALPHLPDVHALLVGAPLFDGDDSYADALRRRAEQRGVTDRIHFLGFREDVSRLMHLVDVVAHTSVAPEPFGRVIVEGMLTGTPVVGTRAGGPSEIIDDPDTGRLLPPDDPHALAAALREILADPEHARAMGTAGRNRARERFSVDRMQQNVAAAIDEARTVQ